MKDKCYLFFETLGTKLKVDIITKLKEKSLSVTELSKQLNQERSKVSHALKSLFECGFIEVKNNGRERIYSLNKDTIIPLLNIVEKHVKKYCKVCKRKGCQ
ncbi:MAG TPA: winged helix-turn-helix domain-containing protein [Candidatus Nanoarchaeia archaeon]|nr:winged helix-turn-helix domain-containing protein [Candidatus Nanoarchaeia archaeon]